MAENKKSFSWRPLAKAVWKTTRIGLKVLIGGTLVVATGASLLLFTTKGNQIAFDLAKDNVEGLQGEIVSGHLGKGLTIENFALAIPDTITVEADKLELSYDIFSLIHKNFVIEDLKAENILLVIGNKPDEMPTVPDFLTSRLYEVASFIQESEKKTMKRVRESIPDPTTDIAPKPSKSTQEEVTDVPEEESKDEFIELPIKIDLKNLSVKNFLMLSDVVDVAVQNLDLTANYTKDLLTVDTANSSYIDVQLHDERMEDSPPSPDEPELKNPFDRKEIESRVEKLPKVFLPLKIIAKELKLNFVRYHQTVYDTGVMTGFLDGSYIGTKINVRYFQVDHELGHASLTDSEMALQDYYPMNVNLKGWSENTEYFDFLDHHTLDASGVGDLTDLKVSATIKGIMDIVAKGRIGSLTPALPFELTLNGKNLGWPVLKPEYKVKDLNAELSGSLNKINSELAIKGINALTYPELNLTSKLTTDLASADIEKLDIVSSDKKTDLSLLGKVSWADIIGFDGDIKANLGNLAAFVPDLTGSLALSVKPKGEYHEDGSWNADINDLAIAGTLQNYPLTLNAEKLSCDSNFNGEISKLSFANALVNTLDIDGVFGDKIDTKANINLADLSLLYPKLTGNLIGDINVGGSLKAPNAKINLDSVGLTYDDLILKDLMLKLDVASKDAKVEKADLALYLHEFYQGKKKFTESLSLKLNGSEEKHNLSLEGRTLAGRLKLKLDGGLKNDRSIYDGEIKELSLLSRELQLVLASVMPVHTVLAPELAVNVGKHDWTLNKNKLEITNLLWNPKKTYLKLTAPEVKVMSFKEFLPKELKLPFSVGLDADIAINNGAPKGNLHVLSRNGSIEYNKNTIDFKEISLAANLEPNFVDADLILNLGTGGLLRTDLKVLDPAGKQPSLAGSYNIDNINLDFISKFSPTVTSSKGFLSGKGNFTGNFENPGLTGYLAISDMDIATAMDIGNISDINTKINFYGQKADLNGGFTLGAKKGSVKGGLSWTSEFDATVKLATEELPVNLMGYGTGKIKLDVAGHFSDRINEVTGNVLIPFARVKVKDLPASSQAASSDVVELERTTDGKFGIKHKSALPLRLDMGVSLGPDVKVTAMGLKTMVTGNLELKQPPYRQLTITGKIKLIDGIFHAYGQDLQIEKGRISFVGDAANPNLDIRAIRTPQSMQNDNVTVGVSVTGNASKPRISIFSKPQLSQSEALSYLLRGKGMDASTANSSDMSNQLLLGVGLMQTSSFISDLGENLGLQDVALDSKGDGDETAVEVSAYIMPKVQVAYGYGIYNAMSEFRLRYEMFPRFYIEGVSSVEQAVDALYKFEFDF